MPHKIIYVSRWGAVFSFVPHQFGLAIGLGYKDADMILQLCIGNFVVQLGRFSHRIIENQGMPHP